MKKSLSIIAGAAIIAAAMFLSPLRPRTRTVHAITTDKAELPVVAVARASLQDLSRDLVVTAEFQPYQEVDVMAKVAGYVKKINVDIGDHVRQGQLLATLEVPEMGDDITKAEATLSRNTADVARAKDELNRAESAHDIAHLTYTRLAAVSKSRPGLVAQQEIDDAHGKDLVAEAQVSAAKSALAASQEQVKVAQAEQGRTQTLYKYTLVTAPFTGVITKRYADTGSMIQAGIASQTQAEPVVRLSQNDLLRLILPVPESAVPRVHLGSPVEVRVPSLNRSFPGRVARFADKLQLGTRTMDTEVDVRNPNLVLVPGMFAEARLQLDQRNKALAVPVTALGGSEDRPTVYVVDPAGKIEERPVAVGLQTSTRAEIRSGLSDGDLVVVGNRSELTAGEAVKPKVVEMAALKGEQ